MEHETKGIRYQSMHFKRVQGLMSTVNTDTLMRWHRAQSQKKAKGIDGMDKAQYDAQAEENIRKLVERMKKFQYVPQPVRRVYIPKANGKLRPLGIPAYEDRLVQGAMADALNNVYEPRFLDCSYGFRPNRSAHDVIAMINDTIMEKNVNYVLEADIKGFFDNVNHDWLMKFLAHDIDDKNFLRYVKRFLKAGVMEGTELTESDRGTPQGGQISPILANVYLHYVLDLWFMKAIKPRMRGEFYYFRFADDFIALFQYESDARRVMDVIRKRLQKFSLEVAEDKTRILPFGRNTGTKADFDFLGFTFYNTTKRFGGYRVGIRTSMKKLKAKRQAIKEWLRQRLHRPLDETMRLLNMKLRGHCNYYGVNGNYKKIAQFYQYARRTTHRMLDRRSQRGHMTSEKFKRTWKYYITPPRITKQIWNWFPKEGLKSCMP